MGTGSLSLRAKDDFCPDIPFLQPNQPHQPEDDVEVRTRDGGDPSGAGPGSAINPRPLSLEANDTRRETATRLVDKGRRAQGLPPLKKPQEYIPSAARQAVRRNTLSWIRKIPPCCFAGQDCHWSVR